LRPCTIEDRLVRAGWTVKWLKVDRIISIATLVVSLVALFLVLKKPHSVAAPQAPAAVAANAQSFENKLEQLEQAKAQGQPQEVHLNADEVNAAMAQAMGAAVAVAPAQVATGAAQSAAGSGAAKPVTTTTEGLPLPAGVNANDQATVKDYQVSFEGDLIKGQFLTEVAGKDVWVTLTGHLGSQNGYATFDPTEFKVGDLNVPVSLVNDALQKKLLEQRDRLKLPDFVDEVGVENGELVMKQK
jgi:hypothetical protein